MRKNDKLKNKNSKWYLKHKYCIVIALSLFSICLFLFFQLVSLNKVITDTSNQLVSLNKVITDTSNQAARNVFELNVYNSCYKKLTNGKKDKYSSDYCFCMAKKMGKSINWNTRTFIDYPNIKYSDPIYSDKLFFKHKKECKNKLSIKK